MSLGINRRLVATGKCPGWALIGHLGPVSTPGVGEGRFRPIPKGRCEALLPEEGRLDLGSAKATEQWTKAPPALTFDASGAGCLPGEGCGQPFLQKEVVFALGLGGHMRGRQVAERVLV